MDANWWTNALASYDVGRQHRQDREYGEAYADGGLSAVERAAGGMGDLQTATQVRRFQDDERQRGYERMEQIAPWARNVIRASRNMDPARARPFLEQHQQRFLDFGLTPDQIAAGIAGLTSDNPEERAQWAETLDQAFTQHQNPEWQLNQGTGQVFAVDPGTGQVQTGGTVEIAPEWQTDGQVPYRISPEGEVIRGAGAIPHRPRASDGGSGGVGDGYRLLTPEEVQELGLPTGRAYQVSPRGQITTVGGAQPQLAGAEQRGRLVLTFPNIVEAQELMARLERNAIDRQGTHGSDTPLGQDWGARLAEAIPWDGGTLARAIGGADYQAYETASRTFEQSVMPIFSGSAVTESEALRFVRSNLPRMGDTQATLRQKALNRARIINAAATILGEPPPYPEAGTWTPAGGLVREQGAPTGPSRTPSTQRPDPLGIR